MIASAFPQLYSSRNALDTDEKAFGFLRSSIDVADDPRALLERFEEDGYLYLPGYLDREMVLEARRSVTDRLGEAGLLEPGTDPILAVAKRGAVIHFKPELAADNPEIDRVIYGERVLSFYRMLLGGAVRHYDFTWFRAVGPGPGTAAHCDRVYMGRGTPRVFTGWAPYGDVSLELGGLILLEASHRKSDLLRSYLARDVDAYCSNAPEAEEYASGKKWWGGALSRNLNALRHKLGGRWLTAEFRAGDFLTFGLHTVHASLDNQTRCVRLSSDSRYQLASEPVDERWVGSHPAGHSSAGKRGRIC